MAGHADKISTYQYRRRPCRNFPVGSLVEVKTDEEGFQNVYFSATVISPPPSESIKSGNIFVEYKHLLAGEGANDRLRESVEVAFLRPTPPEEIAYGFELGDTVDAFYKDGWWIGVVSRVVKGGKRFVVTFDQPKDMLEFGLDKLRTHWNWVNGKWVRPQGKDGLIFGVGGRVEVSFDGEELQNAWFPATIQKNLKKGKFLVEYTSPNGEVVIANVDSLHMRPFSPLFKGKNNIILLEKVGAFFNYGWWHGVIKEYLENSRCLVFFQQLNLEKEFNLLELRPYMEWKDGKWLLYDTMGQEESHSITKTGAAQVQEVLGAVSSCTKRSQHPSESGSTALKKHKEGNVEGNVSSGSANSVKTSANQALGIRSKCVGRNIEGTLFGLDQEKDQRESAGLLELNHTMGQEESQNIIKTGAAQVQEGHHKNEFDEEVGSTSLIDGTTPKCLIEGEKQSLHLIKSSSFWKNVESMEVFKTIPQKPHFKPLEQVSKELREGLAMGYMITFARLIESVSMLQINSGTLETIAALEEQGFDVSAVKKSVTEVLLVKDKEERLLDEMNNLKYKIVERNHEKSRIEEGISEIEEGISEIVENLKKSQAKKMFAESSLGKEVEYIAFLQGKQEEAQENIKKARGDVARIVSALVKVLRL